MDVGGISGLIPNMCGDAWCTYTHNIVPFQAFFRRTYQGLFWSLVQGRFLSFACNYVRVSTSWFVSCVLSLVHLFFFFGGGGGGELGWFGLDGC